MSSKDPNNTYVIGIAGGTASGKSALTRQLSAKLGEECVVCISHDSYYKDNSTLSFEQRKELNYDHPSLLETSLLVEHIMLLKLGKSVNKPAYDFSTHSRLRESQVLKPKPIIMVEGILLFSDPELVKLFDLKIFVDVEADLRVLRRLERDISERGRTYQDVISQYNKTVKPMHDKFVEPSKKHADIIIPEGGHNKTAIELVYSYILSLPAVCP